LGGLGCEPSTADIIGAAAAALAALVAMIAWFTSDETLRTSVRPVLRPVPLWTPPSRERSLNPSEFKIKNYGNGTALSVMLVAADRPTDVVGRVAVVEPLGASPDGDETKRVGNTRMVLASPTFFDGAKCRLFCQDIRGTWHETRIEVIAGGFKYKILKPKRAWHFRDRVPPEIRAKEHVATIEDS
jgi:hypothetical protein